MFFQKKPRKLLTHLCCVVIKGYTYLGKPVGKSSKSTTNEVFLRNFSINLRVLASNNDWYIHISWKKSQQKHFEIVVINITPPTEDYSPTNLAKKFLANFQIKSPHYNGGGAETMSSPDCFIMSLFLSAGISVKYLFSFFSSMYSFVSLIRK